MARAVDRKTLDDLAEDPALDRLELGRRRPDRPRRAVALGDREAAVVDEGRVVAVEGQPPQGGDREAERLRQRLRVVELRQLVLAGPLLGVAEIPAVEVEVVVPEDPLAEVDDVGLAVGEPRLLLEPQTLGGLGLERLLVAGELGLRHAVGRLALDQVAALLELLADVVVDAPGLVDAVPEIHESAGVGSCCHD